MAEAFPQPETPSQTDDISKRQTLHDVDEPTEERLQDSGSKRVRDPNERSGETDAQKAYGIFFKKYYPDFMSRVYRVPEEYFGHPEVLGPKKLYGVLSGPVETVPVKLYGTEKSDIKCDIAEKRVADNIECLLKYWLSNKDPAFIITNYKFEQFYDESVDLSDEDEDIDGEHDILIIHYKCGIIPIQVKSCDSNPKPSIENALTQLKKDENFFKRKFGYLNLDVSLTKIVALPNIPKDELVTEMRKPKYRNPNRLFTESDFDKWLFKDSLLVTGKTDYDEESKEKDSLLEWWERVSEHSNGFTSIECFLAVVERYIGERSTVHIPHPLDRHVNDHSLDMRRKGHAVSKMAKTNIVLTPYQSAVLDCNSPRLVIRGPYGTGKTVVLILKARMLLRNLEKVCIISMANSPLIHLLEASVRQDLDHRYFPSMMFRSCNSQNLDELTTLIQDLKKSGERWNILIDEFPSLLFGNRQLRDAIESFPPHPLFWVVCSREKETSLSKGPYEVFKDFQKVVFDTILRCPSSLHHLFPRSETKTEKDIVTYPRDKLKNPNCCEAPKRKISRHLHELGLSTSLTRLADPDSEVKKDSGNKWSDLSIVDGIFADTKRSFHTQLKKLNVPLVRVSDVMNFSETDVQEVKERRSNRALYTKRADVIQDAVHVSSIKDSVFKIYRRGTRDTCEEISDLAKYLKAKGFESGSSFWSDLVFVDAKEVDEPEMYTFLKDLGIPLCTPCERNKVFQDCAVYITSDFKGYQRKETIELISGDKQQIHVKANVKEESASLGFKPKYFSHSNHTDELAVCAKCKNDLMAFLDSLGLELETRKKNLSRTIDHPEDESKNILELARNPRWNICFSDLVVIDDRENSTSAAELFRRCGVPIVDKLNDKALAPGDAFGSDTEVLYIKPNLFQGLERKVVIVIKNSDQRFRNPVRNGQIVDFTEVAISRCSSQLIVINT